MKKKVWIINHYAGNTFFEKSGRHYWFAKYLRKKGYEPVVFCCNAKHGEEDCYINEEGVYFEENANQIHTPYIFVKGRTYSGNGTKRIFNMIDFYINVKRAAKEYAVKTGKPDIIIASSVHPLTLIAGLQLARSYNTRCICEIRDAWPFTLIEYGLIKKNGIIAKVLYKMEKYIYVKADQIVFTFRDGVNYINDNNWDNEVKLSKIFYINNGVDLEEYEAKIKNNTFADKDLDSDKFKLVYIGAMGPPNCIDKIIEAAKKIKSLGMDDVIFLLYGDGILKNEFEKLCEEKNINNVFFKGKIGREFVPFVLSKSNANLFTIKDSPLYKYGISPNKIFEYLASGKPIITNSKAIYSITKEADCVFENSDLAKAVLEAYNLEHDCSENISNCAKDIIKEYDFDVLTQKLISIIEVN